MYAGGLLLFLSKPIALGSYWGLLDEENSLASKLPGNPEYCARVRWRLIPEVFLIA